MGFILVAHLRVTRFAVAALLLGTNTPAAERDSSVYALDLRWDIPITLVALTGIIVPNALTSALIKPSCPCDPSSVNAFDRWAIGHASNTADSLSTVTQDAAIVIPVVADLFDARGSTAFLEDAVVFGETIAVNGAMATAAKYTVQRPIPRVYTGNPAYVNSPSDYRSFYSGHTSTTFAALSAAAMTYQLRHGDAWWPWLVTAVVGTSVGAERVLAGRHFPTDVLVAGLAGTAVGVVVPWLHAKARFGDSRLMLSPAAGGVQLAWVGTW